MPFSFSGVFEGFLFDFYFWLASISLGPVITPGFDEGELCCFLLPSEMFETLLSPSLL